MLARIVTTITTDIDIDTMTPSHDVDINSHDDLPRNIVVAAVTGALRSTLKSLGAADGGLDE